MSRLGIINITEEAVNSSIISEVFYRKKIFAVAITDNFEKNSYLYKCVSDNFDIVEEGNLIPEYILEISVDGDGNLLDVHLEKVT